MRTKMVAALVAVVGSLAMAPAAEADWYISKWTAQSFARDAFHKRYEAAGRLLVSCRPQWARRGEPGYDYHRWVCTWVDMGDDTYGAFQIAGSRVSSENYNSRVLNGVRYL